MGARRSRTSCRLGSRWGPQVRQGRLLQTGYFGEVREFWRTAKGARHGRNLSRMAWPVWSLSPRCASIAEGRRVARRTCGMAPGELVKAARAAAGTLNCRPRTIQLELDVPELGPGWRAGAADRAVRHLWVGSASVQQLTAREPSWATIRRSTPPPNWVGLWRGARGRRSGRSRDAHSVSHLSYCRGVGSRPETVTTALPVAAWPRRHPARRKPLLSGGWSDFVELPRRDVHRIAASVRGQTAAPVGALSRP